MAIDRGIALLDAAARHAGQVIHGDQIPWERYLKPEDKAKVIPAEVMAEQAKAEMLLGTNAEPGLRLPWSKTDGRVFMRAGTLILWAGWSRHGKSRMLKQVMLHAIKNGEKPLIASMEEGVRAVWKDMCRMACCAQDPEPRNIDRFIEFVSGNLWLYDQYGMVDPRKLAAVIRYAIAELKVTHAVVDSLMMLAIGRDDYEAQARFVSDLHSIAMNTGATIHLVAHMRKREGKSGEESIGSMHDVSGGHEIGSMADSIFVVWRDLSENPQVPCVLRIEKQSRNDVDWIGNIGLNFHAAAKQYVEDVFPMRFLD